MFWHMSVHPSICLSTGGDGVSPAGGGGGGSGQVNPGGGGGQVQLVGGVRSSQWGGGGVRSVQVGAGLRSSWSGGGQVQPVGGGGGQVQLGGGGCVSQDRTTEWVLTTRWAVCLLCSRRRTFLLHLATAMSLRHRCDIAPKSNQLFWCCIVTCSNCDVAAMSLGNRFVSHSRAMS